MNIFFLILGLVTSEASYELIKIPIGYAIKQITCEQAFKNNTRWVVNPHYKDGNGQIFGYYKHKDKIIFMHYCKDSKGDWVR